MTWNAVVSMGIESVQSYFRARHNKRQRDVCVISAKLRVENTIYQ